MSLDMSEIIVSDQVQDELRWTVLHLLDLCKVMCGLIKENGLFRAAATLLASVYTKRHKAGICENVLNLGRTCCNKCRPTCSSGVLQ
jgi:hypothetical protein